MRLLVAVSVWLVLTVSEPTHAADNLACIVAVGQECSLRPGSQVAAVQRRLSVSAYCAQEAQAQCRDDNSTVKEAQRLRAERADPTDRP